MFFLYDVISTQIKSRALRNKELQLKSATVLEVRDVTYGTGRSLTTFHHAKLDLRGVGRKEFTISAILRKGMMENDSGIAVLSLDGKQLWHFENLHD